MATEVVPEPLNPLGVDGIEFIEYATSQPQAFGALLQQMGFAAVARHRSREVVLYRQGGMNLVVNSHHARERWCATGMKPMRCSTVPSACGCDVAYSMNSMPSMPTGLDGSGRRSSTLMGIVWN